MQIARAHNLLLQQPILPLQSLNYGALHFTVGDNM